MTEDWRAEPRRGDMIRVKVGHRRVARRIVEVTPSMVLTVGMSGRQRDRWMRRERLARYELLSREG